MTVALCRHYTVGA